MEKLIAAPRCAGPTEVWQATSRVGAGGPRRIIMFPASCFIVLESILLRVQAMGEQRATNPHRSTHLNCSTSSQSMGPALWAGKCGRCMWEMATGGMRGAHHAHREAERHSPHPHADGGVTCTHCPRREVAFAAPPPKRRGRLWHAMAVGWLRMQIVARDRQEVAFAAPPQLNGRRHATFGSHIDHVLTGTPSCSRGHTPASMGIPLRQSLQAARQSTIAEE